ncbi:beta-1,3-glucan-binding protein-like [Sitophilus oryzae]|uniref:Beta-1,3-glucan-binding protein-like n=1 Tax=Sitophilus oryzae TaxID=7048 RepID=A0A6J2Y0K7_SITOR|nr:beta-1,3-glucan-binding protein-like [Sitophilus oryzae]
MDYYNKLVFLLLILFIRRQKAFKTPPLTIESFIPSGLRISIPADPGFKLFGVHFNINKEIPLLDKGDYHADISLSENGKLIYYNPTLKLKDGDIVYYWAQVQVQNEDVPDGHIKLLLIHDSKIVSPKKPSEESNTVSNIREPSIVNKTSNKDVILDAKFSSNSIDENIWLIEQYYAAEPDYEYVIYKNYPSVLSSQNNLLHIIPQVDENIVTSDVNIDGCTRNTKDECNRVFFNFYQHPIISARLVTKKTFSFGEYQVRAKLPKGDWLFPEIYLEDIDDLSKRMWIAYARGNEELTTDDGKDIGGRVLYGGPVVEPVEPGRSRYLSTYKHIDFIGNEMHTFTLRWTADQINLYMDGNKLGSIGLTILKETGFNTPRKMRLVLGVGAGGPRNFPDHYHPKTYVKLWNSTSNKQVKMFFKQKSQWLPTWKNGELQVEFVKITAL